MKARSFFSAGVLLAVALIFSCSSSDDDDNGGDDNGGGGGGGSSSSVGGGSSPSGGIDLTNLPLSYDGVLEGKIDVFLLEGEYSRLAAGERTLAFIGGDTLPAGKIENGILSLSLPSIPSKDSKYRFKSWSEELDGDDEVSIVPQDLAFHQSGPLFAIIPGKGSCYIKGILKNEAMNYGRALLFTYNSASGSVSGTGVGTYYTGGVEYRQEGKFNLNISQGWQVIYDYAWNRDMYENISYAKIAHITTDLPANTTVEWKCSSNYDDDDDGRSSSSSGGGDLQSYYFCVFDEAQTCLVGPFTSCPSGGVLFDICPVNHMILGGGDTPSSSSVVAPSSSSTGGGNPQSYSYCVYPDYQMCFDGPYTSCSSGGILSNSCPFGGGGVSSSSAGGGDNGVKNWCANHTLGVCSNNPGLLTGDCYSWDDGELLETCPDGYEAYYYED